MELIKLKLMYISLIIVILMLTNVSYAEINPADIAGIWLLNEGNGDEAVDTSGNENHGIVKGKPGWVKGKYGQALEFDGVDDFVEVLASNIGAAEQLTVSVLVKPGNQTAGNFGDHKDIVRSHCFGGGKWGICTLPGYNGNNLLQIHVAWIDGGDTWWQTAGKQIAAKDEWNSITMIWDRDAVKATLYRNGEKVGENVPAKGGKPITTGFRIGNDCAGPFKGVIDEVAIFNVALAQDDIEKIAIKGVEWALNPISVNIYSKLATEWGQIKAK